ECIGCFFFQAEDGIRDGHVTGVQTCALPISAMEGAGKLVEDEELREAMRERGLGTPATRSQIIEGLIHDGYIERKGKELIVSAKGLSLITLLRNLHTDVLCTPEMTGEWES